MHQLASDALSAQAKSPVKSCCKLLVVASCRVWQALHAATSQKFQQTQPANFACAISAAQLGLVTASDALRALRVGVGY
jgi:hypothetical protein